jgi:hypothetical protein
MVMTRSGLELEKDCAGEVQQQLLTTDPNSRQKGRPTSITLRLCKDNFKKDRKIGHGLQERLAD